MELKHIKELMGAMARSGTKRLVIKKEGFELELEREDNAVNRQVDTLLESPEDFMRNPLADNRTTTPSLRPISQSKASPEPEIAATSTATPGAAGTFVTAPMVGTFYSSPSPDDPTFVKVGDKVEKNTVVCIIEAMKVMNEVKAGVSGTIAEIQVESGHPVEFGTKLFRIV